MKKEVKFSLVYRDMWQSSGKYVPRKDQLEKIAPLIIEMGCFYAHSQQHCIKAASSATCSTALSTH